MAYIGKKTEKGTEVRGRSVECAKSLFISWGGRGGGEGLEDFDCVTKKFLILVLNFRKFLFLLGLFYGVSKRGNFKDFIIKLNLIRKASEIVNLRQ